MKSIIQAMLEEIYTKATIKSREFNQVLQEAYNHGKGDYYITLSQLEAILCNEKDPDRKGFLFLCGKGCKHDPGRKQRNERD